MILRVCWNATVALHAVELNNWVGPIPLSVCLLVSLVMVFPSPSFSLGPLGCLTPPCLLYPTRDESLGLVPMGMFPPTPLYMCSIAPALKLLMLGWALSLLMAFASSLGICLFALNQTGMLMFGSARLLSFNRLQDSLPMACLNFFPFIIL